MAKGGAVRAGRVYVELLAKDDRLGKGVKRASARLKAFEASVAVMGARLMGLGLPGALPLAASILSKGGAA